VRDVYGKRALVVGLARSGRVVSKVLAQHGAEVTVTDVRPTSAFGSDLRELTTLKIGLELGRHRESSFLDKDFIVVSPGVPWDMPHLVTARRKNIEIIPEIEVASWYLRGTLVGVTGSNGKTTTTTLLGKMLEASDLPAFVGGNIGVPLSSAVELAQRDTVLVAELSSFQLEAIQTFRPNVAVLLNLSPNHLDRHGSFEAYIGAKARIFHNQRPEDYAILNADDHNVAGLAPAIASQKIFFSRRQNLPNGVFVSNSHIIYRVGNLERVLLGRADLKLRGDFNMEDVLAASAAACVVGADSDAIRRAVKEFKGVEHRLEFACEIHGVEFFNDSKATSVDATLQALTAFERGVHLIMGGKDKGAPYAPLLPLIRERVKEVLVIGAAAEKIAAELGNAVELVRSGDLETATRTAFSKAAKGDVVLLAPACASYDQFRDYEERGRIFKELVERLAAETSVADSISQVEIVTPEPAKSAPREPNPYQPTPSAELPKAPDNAAPLEVPPAPTPAMHDVQPISTPATAKPSTPAEPEPVPIPQPKPASISPALEESAASSLVRAAGIASDERSKPEREIPAQSAPELIYVYEVGAENVAPLALDAGMTLPEEPISPWTTQFAECGAAADEPMPFEVAAAPRAGAEARGSTTQNTETKSAGRQEQPSLFEHTVDAGPKSQN